MWQLPTVGDVAELLHSWCRMLFVKLINLMQIFQVAIEVRWLSIQASVVLDWKEIEAISATCAVSQFWSTWLPQFCWDAQNLNLHGTTSKYGSEPQKLLWGVKIVYQYQLSLLVLSKPSLPSAQWLADHKWRHLTNFDVASMIKDKYLPFFLQNMVIF